MFDGFGRVDVRYEPCGYGLYVGPMETNTVCFRGKPLGEIDPAHRILTLPHQGCFAQRARGATAMGLVTRLSYPCRPCACNVVHALTHRHLAKRPDAKKSFTVAFGVLDGLRDAVVAEYEQVMLLGYDAWLRKWPEGKQFAIKLSLVRESDRPRWVKAMIKRECNHSFPRRARLIQYYVTLCTQERFAREIFGLQHAYAAVLQRYEVAPGLRVTMACGMNAEALGVWMEEACSSVSQPHVYERDGRSWDSTVNHEMHKLKCHAYAYPGIRGLVDFVNECEVVRGKWRAGSQVCRYLSNGCTKSGHNDTTLGNSLINAMITVEVAIAMRLRGDIMVAGDDMIFVVEGDFDEHEFARREAEYGILPEYRKWADPGDASFISGIWARDGGRLRFIPKPGRLLARLFWTMNPPGWKKRDSYMHSVVAGLRVLSLMPVMRVLLAAHDVVGAKLVKVSKRDVKFDRSEPFECEAYFCSRYRTTPSEIAEVEGLIKQALGKPSYFRHPLFDRMEAVDLADVASRELG